MWSTEEYYAYGTRADLLRVFLRMASRGPQAILRDETTETMCDKDNLPLFLYMTSALQEGIYACDRNLTVSDFPLKRVSPPSKLSAWLPSRF